MESIVDGLHFVFSQKDAKEKGYDLTPFRVVSNDVINSQRAEEQIISRCYKYKFIERGIQNPTDIDIIRELTRIRGESQTLKILKALNKEKKDLFGFNTIQPTKEQVFIFGSPDSTDIDVAVILDHTYDEKIDILTDEIDHEMLKGILKEFGYDIVNRDIDCSLIIVDENGDVLRTSKGTCIMTQNIIFSTYKYHSQFGNDNLPIKRMFGVEYFDVCDSVKAISKCFLDNLKFFVGKKVYSKEKHNKARIYTLSEKERINYILDCAKLVLDPPITKDKELKTWYDGMKSLVMKLVQLILLNNGILEYDKTKLSKKLESSSFVADCSDIYSHVRWYLSRGNEGIFCRKCLYNLLESYKIIAFESVIEVEWIDLPVNIENNPTRFSNEFWKEFVKSPIVPTNSCIKEFCSVAKEEFDIDNINSIFVEKSYNYNLLPKDFLENHVHIESQKSERWCELLKFYSCGKNSGVKKTQTTSKEESVRVYWNLIRGCVGECIAKNNVYLNVRGISYVDVIEVGLLVEKKERACKGIAPDGLLLEEDMKMIPIEVKCITGEHTNNHNYRRELSLAKRQIDSSKKILNDADLLSEKGGLLLFIYVNPNRIECKMAFV
jgi:hypothetical protein